MQMPHAAPPGPWRTFPPVVTGIMIACVVMFMWQGMDFERTLIQFALWPAGTDGSIMTPAGAVEVPGFRPWQVLSHAFLHGGFFHIFVNMLALWMFGVQLENIWGSARFAFYYFFCVIGAGTVQLVVASIAAADGNIYPTVGASGGVFGILLAFGLMFPNQRVVLLIPPVPMKAKWFVALFAVISLVAGVTGTLGNVAHFAHLGGMVFGLLLMLYWGGRLPWKPRLRIPW
jgi:membrane associated rhomboid family serine protease